MGKVILLCIALLLFGCEDRAQITPSQSTTALGDAQRNIVMEQTDGKVYAVFPDTDDVAKLKDSTFLDAMHAIRPNGSAFAMRADGLVATNMHVIEGTNYCTGEENAEPKNPDDAAREAGRQKEEAARRESKKATHCIFVTQSFTKAFRARLVKVDEKHDIALLCLENQGQRSPFIKLAPYGSFKKGSEVITIGSPLGNMNMLTLGYISNLDFIPEDRETGVKGTRKIQFTAPILPGNSGGPLLSVATGEVVGQVVAIIMLNGIPTQMSYANPVEFLRENMNETPPCEKK
jgi:S1-C subfamily serine protease